MKKIWIGIMLCVFLAAGIACAEGNGIVGQESLLDMSGYTDEEMILLMQQVNEEIVRRNIEKSAHLPTGTYIGGRDIPVGSYILTGEGREDDHGIVSLGTYDEEGQRIKREVYESVYSSECNFYIVVDEGETLTVPFACKLTINAGIRFE